MKQKFWKLPFFLPGVILPLLYAAGYITQFFINYNRWLENGNGPGSTCLLYTSRCV